MGGIVKGLEGYPQIINGIEDHVHLLIALRSTHRFSDFMRDLKSGSSKWVHDEIGNNDFSWQEGYAAFTVSSASRSRVYAYIANQEQHHGRTPYRDELEMMLKMAGVRYDPRYLD